MTILSSFIQQLSSTVVKCSLVRGVTSSNPGKVRTIMPDPVTFGLWDSNYWSYLRISQSYNIVIIRHHVNLTSWDYTQIQ